MDLVRPVTVSVTRRWWAAWRQKNTLQTVTLVASLAIAFSIFAIIARRNALTKAMSNQSICIFPAIFNFGDSNSDTGGMSALFERKPYPNGETFFHKPSGRYCDGKVVLDFMAEKLGLPYTSAYLDSIGSNFRNGANFATSGSTIQPIDTKLLAGFSPVSLDKQLMQFEQFKARTQLLNPQASESWVKARLPRPGVFSKALYTLDIGQNDLHAGLEGLAENEVLASIPRIISLFSDAVKKLYQLGARLFWIHNTGPIGCLPYFVVFYPPKPENKDPNGCLRSHNKVAKEFNRQLNETVSHLRLQLSEAAFTYVDIYAAKYSLISEANKLGFTNPLGYCCGHYGRDFRVGCGKKAIVNGTELFGAACKDPSVYISWDGIHYSHAANRLVASKILDGILSEPATSITQACHNPLGS